MPALRTKDIAVTTQEDNPVLINLALDVVSNEQADFDGDGFGDNIYLAAPENIYVGNGYFSGEYYDFYTDLEGANQIVLSNYIFFKGSTYTFHKISGNDYPFYLSDVTSSSGSYHMGTLSFPVSSDVSISNERGIKSSESMTLTIPPIYSKNLHYYCTIFYYTSMVEELNVRDPPINNTDDDSW